MSYRIVYGPMPKVKSTAEGNLFRFQLLTAVFLMLFALVVKCFWPQGMAVLQSVLIPGEVGATEVAFFEMLTNLKNGDAMAEAVTAFCRQVIESAEVFH